jgi:hypothetical protein
MSSIGCKSLLCNELASPQVKSAQELAIYEKKFVNFYTRIPIHITPQLSTDLWGSLGESTLNGGGGDDASQMPLSVSCGECELWLMVVVVVSGGKSH